MKRITSLILGVLMLVSVMILPASAASFQVTYYTEEIYAGGVLDLYAFTGNGGVEPFTYQWQAEGFGWIDLEDNDAYEGTKTNHLRVHTITGVYDDWDSIPFHCKVTDAEGTVQYTPNIYQIIRPTEDLIPAMRNWGYGLYEPTLTNVTNLSTRDYKNYTASAYAGAKIEMIIGSKPVESVNILSNSEVQLTREIHITEYGNTIKTTDHTTYIPYTIGTVKVEFKQYLKIGDTDLGEFDSKTVTITTSKPDAIAQGVTTRECSMLRYPYNQSQSLRTLPQGAVVEVLSKDGGYYQVYVRGVGFVGYIPESLLRLDEAVGESVIKNVDVTIPNPVAGEKPSFTCGISTTGCQLYKTDPVTWYDKTAGRYLTVSDTFQENHSYDLSIWVAAKSGYRFQLDAAGDPKLTGSINSNLPPYIHTAYEQDPEKVIELIYNFNNVKPKDPEPTHTCSLTLVARVEPTCTQKGQEAYYRCSCGMCYKDSQGKTAVDIGTWGVLPATGHTPSGWRTTQIVHYKACTTCGEFLHEQDHTGGTATCKQQAKCTVCGYAYGELEDHRWSPTWLYQDETGHAWICADCKGISEVEPHTPGAAATATKPQTCKDCGYIITPAKNHEHDLIFIPAEPSTCTQQGHKEYYFCTGCSECFEDAQGKTRIPEVMSVMLDTVGHTASDTWGCNSEYHWRTCTVCSEVLIETMMFHEAIDGKCATCGCEVGNDDISQLPGIMPSATAEPEPDAPAGTGSSVDAPGSQTQPSAQQAPGWAMAVMIGLICFGVSVATTVVVLKLKKK